MRRTLAAQTHNLIRLVESVRGDGDLAVAKTPRSYRGQRSLGAECEIYEWLGAHPNIARMRPSDSCALFLDASLGSLADWERFPYSNRAVAYAGIQAAMALAHAHRAGIVHRDVKPSNILYDEDRAGLARQSPRTLEGYLSQRATQVSDGRLVVTLADFGTAKPIDARGDEGLLFGTNAYMSPQQARGEHLDASTDIFSLGLVLYTLLTGRRAYGADIAETSVSSHVGRAIRAEAATGRIPPIVERMREYIPRDERTQDAKYGRIVRDAIELCTRYDPHERPHAGALAKWFLERFDAIELPASDPSLGAQGATGHARGTGPYRHVH